MQVFVQGTSTHAVNVEPSTTVSEIRKRICTIEQVSVAHIQERLVPDWLIGCSLDLVGCLECSSLGV